MFDHAVEMKKFFIFSFDLSKSVEKINKMLVYMLYGTLYSTIQDKFYISLYIPV